MDITLSKQFPIVILTGLVMNFHASTQAKDIAQKRKNFFGNDHKKAFKTSIQAGGLPDVGNGLYSQKLSYKDWYEFNVLQRIHLDYIQSLPLALTSLFAAGIYKPKIASVIGGTYIFFRFLYGYFYRNKGANNKNKKLSNLASILCSLANIGIFLYFGYKKWSK